jgi:hypothetical protein
MEQTIPQHRRRQSDNRNNNRQCSEDNFPKHKVMTPRFTCRSPCSKNGLVVVFCTSSLAVAGEKSQLHSEPGQGHAKPARWMLNLTCGRNYASHNDLNVSVRQLSAFSGVVQRGIRSISGQANVSQAGALCSDPAKERVQVEVDPK